MVRLAAALVFALAFGVEAQARTETLRWTHTDASTVTGFRVHWRAGSGSTTTEDAGLPNRDSGGVYSYSLVVPDTADVYFYMTAYNAKNLSSNPSNEICRGPGVPCATGGGGTGGGGTGGGGTGGGTGGTAQSAITGFRLWDASTDQLLDGSFVNGDSIPILEFNCVAIEIMGNSFLNSNGSVMKQLDGSGGGCTTAGATHDNNPPFAWEMDEGPGKFACAASLRVAGAHTLVVTPFDGDDCTGAKGAAVTLQFQTLSLGAPGRPFLVTP